MSKANVRLSVHPRLYIGQPELDRLNGRKDDGFRLRARRLLLSSGHDYLRKPGVVYPDNCHNWHLLRARAMQKKVFTLLACWRMTGDIAFRSVAVDSIMEMGKWRAWSWIAWRQGDFSPDAIFDLSYGENSATLAVAYDLLFPTLSPEEREMFIETACRRSFASALKHACKGGAWWFESPNSNWNSVCAGGIGMLAMAMFEEFDKSSDLLERTERSIEPFMRTLDRTDGGWPEGVGYWNYGMRYAFMYLLSRERAFGESHPLLQLRGVAKTLRFPVEFSPNGQSCGFGDCNGWKPLPFHYAAAARLNHPDVLASLHEATKRVGIDGMNNGPWPDLAEYLLLCPAVSRKAGRKSSSLRSRLYSGIGWGIVADNLAKPSVAVSVRGGNTREPHQHLDLLSFQCVVGNERMIANVNPTAYLDTTFSSRRNELFEIGPFSKNTILVNGLGIVARSELKSMRLIHIPVGEGFRLDATGAFGNDSTVRFCGRVVFLLKKKYVLIVDGVELRHPGIVESRMFTPAKVKFSGKGAVLTGRKEKLRVAYGASSAATLSSGLSTPAMPGVNACEMLRWITKDEVASLATATLLAPGKGNVSVAVKRIGRAVEIVVTDSGRSFRVCLTSRLNPRRK